MNGGVAFTCQNNRFVGVKGGSVFYTDVAVGGNNSYYSPTDYWSPVGIVYGNGIWIIARDDGRVLRSTTNAASFIRHDTPADDLIALVFGIGKFVADTGSASLHSSDGLTWTIGPPIPGAELCFAGGQFHTESHVSADAMTWTPRQLPANTGYLRPGNGDVLTWNYEPQPYFYNYYSGQWSAPVLSGVVSRISDATFCGDLWIAVTDGNKVLTSAIPATPPPVAPPLAIAPALRLSWPSLTGRSYIIQRSLNQTVWTDHTGAILGTGASMEWLAPASGGKEFFRVQVR